MKSIVLVVAGFLSGILLAQDSDTIALRDSERKFTLLTQVEDQLERSAFLNILKATEPETRSQLIGSFIRKYPKSWMLSQAYDLSARAAIDLGKYDQALEAGRFSLRLVPENPSLLIMIANIEAQQLQFESAIQNASDALEYLDNIERPPNLNQSEWTVLRPQLEASAYFARGRAFASRGMTGKAPALLKSALIDLDRAAAWNSSDSEVFYLRALVEIQLQDPLAAASDLAFVVGETSPLQEKAKNLLLALARNSSAKDRSLDEFVKSLPSRTIERSLRVEDPRRHSSQSAVGGYAGPEACRPCHQSQYEAWRKTGMARMLQSFRPENIVGDFTSGTQYTENSGQGSGQDVIRIGSSNRPYFELRGSGSWSRYYVDFTIGSKWQQAYATKLPDGRLQVLPIEYNVLQKKWINYWKLIDPPGSLRANIREFPKLNAATNYQKNCAICHTSQLKADLVSQDALEHATFLEPGIDCEMCHGPSSSHIKQIKNGRNTHNDAVEPPIDFRNVNNRDGVRVCGQCHRQSAVREIGEGGQMNYSTKDDFISPTWQRPLDAFSRKAFYKDGRFRETTFIVEAFTRSACYRRGTAQCATCHSPHLGDFENNQTSLKFKSDPNQMCLGCHQTLRLRIAEHTRHASGSDASQCVTCHMPRIMNALLSQARSHQIEIPTVDLTLRFGQQESPNVCLSCHADKTTVWIEEQLASWPR